MKRILFILIAAILVCGAFAQDSAAGGDKLAINTLFDAMRKGDSA